MEGILCVRVKCSKGVVIPPSEKIKFVTNEENIIDELNAKTFYKITMRDKNSLMYLTADEYNRLVIPINSSKISDEVVENFITDIKYTKIGSKTIVGVAILKNDYEVVESTAPVNLEDFNIEKAKFIVKIKLYNKIKELLSFTNQFGGLK